jgi:hypothetical protein
MTILTVYFRLFLRAWLDVIGHLSLHSMTDAWLSQIAYCVDIWERIDINVVHDRADLTGNNQDALIKIENCLKAIPTIPEIFIIQYDNTSNE